MKENISKEGIIIKKVILQKNDNRVIQDPFELEESEVHAKKIISYWRSYIADEDRIGLSQRELQEAIEIDVNEIEKGKIDASLIEALFQEADDRLFNKIKYSYDQKRYNKEIEEIRVNELNIIIAPFVVKRNVKHGELVDALRSVDEMAPLWMVGVLKRTGEIQVYQDETLPWIDRRCLSPNESKIEFPIIGDVQDVDDFYSSVKNPFSLSESNWIHYYSYAIELLRYVTQNDGYELFRKQGYSILKKSRIFLYDDRKGYSRNLIQIYDQYLHQDSKIPKILKTITSFNETLLKKNVSEIENVDNSRRHLGQMSSNFILSKSQRLTLSEFLDEKSDDIFAVNGPPGTGKTTLLQSIIATLVVEKALARAQIPPIIVASSTNNQAITNILDSFKMNVNEGDLIEKRWLPHVSSYGTYLASGHKEDYAKKYNYLYRLKQHESGNVSSFYSKEYFENSKEKFLNNCEKYFQGKYNDIDKAQNEIYKNLKKVHDDFLYIINSALNLKKQSEFLINNFQSRHFLEQEILEKSEKLKKLYEQKKIFLDHKTDWLKYWSGNLFWPRLFSYIPFVRNILSERFEIFLTQKNIELLSDVDVFSFKNYLNNEIEKKLSEIKICEVDILGKEKFLHDYDESQKRWDTISNHYFPDKEKDSLLNFNDEENILGYLDRNFRSKMFYLSIHYWEAEWLRNCLMFNSLSYSFHDRKLYWGIQSMLTPCLVTTMQSGPSFFKYKAQNKEYESPSEFFDLLIIDEAGQVNSALSGAMISLAKRIIAVGDVYQIGPVVSVNDKIDMANFKRYLQVEEDHIYSNAVRLGICALKGSVMKLVQNKSSVQREGSNLRGSYLLEHRRCVPEIIQYSNEMCYQGNLIPMRKGGDFFLPRMGYAHIKGECNKNKSGSRINRDEILALVNWIKKRSNQIINYYESLDKEKYRSLEDCIGVITPFVANAAEIVNLFRRNEIEINRVGTVHTFQGAEMPIIIFLPVYSFENSSVRYFFDNSPNMLNVAVSRAKDSFLVFGDMDIFDQTKTNTPSGLLGKHLFASPSNEILDVVNLRYKKIPNEVRHITTLENHRKILKESFEKANVELNIVSPFLRLNAIKEDEIILLIKKRSTQINISIFTDPYLNCGDVKDEFNKCINLLREAGAYVYCVKNFHSKILMIDHSVIVEGSFNWLSASRNFEKYKREESSILYSGHLVESFILESLKLLNEKKMGQQDGPLLRV